MNGYHSLINIGIQRWTCRPQVFSFVLNSDGLCNHNDGVMYMNSSETKRKRILIQQFIILSNYK